jgi:uncharacterized repeat protein (TIGR01451 family)
MLVETVFRGGAMPATHHIGRALKSLARLPRFALAVGLIAAVLPLYMATSAEAALLTTIPVGFSVTTDSGLVNDVNAAQNDLTQMGVDNTGATQKIFWSWDSTDMWAGVGQTGNACALFDKNGNGNIDFAICVSIHNPLGDPSVVEPAPAPLFLFTCNDSRNDRCSHPSSPVSFGGDIVLSPLDPAHNSDYITATDPFAGGSNFPNDATVEVDISKAFLTTSGGTLLNVCSYPSAANGGNNNPFDCILAPGPQPPSISLDKSADKTVVAAVGDVIHYTLTATNDGGVNLTNAVISDPMFPAASLTCVPTQPVATLAPSDTIVCTVSHTVTQADLDAGSIANTATATGTPPAGANVTDTDSWTVTGTQSPAFTFTKSASPTTYTAAGQTITYTLTETNTGNVTLHNVTITDPLITVGACDNGLVPPTAVATPATLAPGGTLRCTGTHVTTAADVNTGSFRNVATGHGTPPGANAQPITHDANATVTLLVIPPPPPPVPGSPALSVTKSSVPVSGSFVHVGDQIVYTLSYRNSGTGPATSVVLTDTLQSDLDYVVGSATAPGTYDTASRTLTWSLGTLAVGANGTVNFTGQVASTATNGEALNNVSVLTAPGITDPSNTTTHTVVVPAGDLTLTKHVSKDSAEYGDNLVYTLNVAATGNLDQTNVVVTDKVPTGTTYVDNSAACISPCTATEAGGTVTWTVGTLAAGSSMALTFQVTVDQATPAADGSIPATKVDDTGTASSDQEPLVQSNKVSTVIVAVLGEKVIRKPTTKPSSLPFTGLPFPLWPALALSLAMVLVGTAVSIGLRQPKPVEERTWRDV